ncbi:ribosome recycling factor [Thermanaerosceptrum fracticalcis]|uniref:Ribosome-recycling factor n=1 Tax=Thermanaerosceptrum fracticalcis TaxID=1712410 RepID=A0A7G6E0Y4_THEFR|nr:ribosome recycling factor [Thermanaerosceptrum fracticalcis]QNB45738.1 ribosome recycling factor [Thermanaerosceptrum fracticalcis]
MVKDVIKETEDKMKKTIEVLRKDYATLRAGRANPAILEKVTVDYYGTPTPINQVANISAPEPRLLTIQPWDKSLVPTIEKAILKSDLGLNPSSDGNLIRIVIPQLTQERRLELVKTIKKKAEEARVSIRNIRRDSNDKVKNLEKTKVISEDETKKGQDEIQKLTDKYIKEVDHVLEVKEKEIMEV